MHATQEAPHETSWFVEAIGEVGAFAGRLLRNFFKVFAIGIGFTLFLSIAAYIGLTGQPLWRAISVCALLTMVSAVVSVLMAGNLSVVLSLAETVRAKGLAKRVLDALFSELLGVTDQRPQGTQEHIQELHGMSIDELRRKLKLAGKRVLDHPIATSIPRFVRWLLEKAERLLVWATVKVIIAYATAKADEQRKVDLLALRANLTELADDLVTRRITQGAVRLALLFALGATAFAWAIVKRVVRLSGLFVVVGFMVGCRSAPPPATVAGPTFHVLSYNVNWGGAGASEAVDIIRNSRAHIVCLQETTPHWETYLTQELRAEYRFRGFRNSEGRMGGGLAFLSKTPLREVAYIPSETGWFDGWIVETETPSGSVQIMNVHLRPPVGDRGGWVSGYFNTRDDRLAEMERFYSHSRMDLPMIVAGDFNDSENSSVVRWLEEREFENALPRFDSSTPTWRWNYRGLRLSRRMDHILFSPELQCADAEVIEAGKSDHYPVVAEFSRHSAKPR